MNKRAKLKLCNKSLFIVLLALIVSIAAIIGCGHNEMLGLPPQAWTHLHITLAIILIALVVWHLQLHFGWRKWRTKISKLKSPATPKLYWIIWLTAISGLAAFIVDEILNIHTPLGGIHGIIGLLALLFSLGHLIKRRDKLFTKKP